MTDLRRIAMFFPSITAADRSFAGLLVFTLLSSITSTETRAQQFAGDNQWVAPHGVGTFVATAGEEYAQFYAVAALIPEWEFNVQLNYYYEHPNEQTGSYVAVNLYAKRRLWESEAQTTGYAFLAGTGLFPEYIEQGEVADPLQTWWVTGVATYGFANDRILLDILPGGTVNFDKAQSGATGWGLTYTSRVAVYDVIPQSAIVGEVFGSAGEAYAEPSYRIGVRWESPKWIVAATYSNAFDGSTGAGFELGILYFTDAIFCFGGCKK